MAPEECLIEGVKGVGGPCGSSQRACANVQCLCTVCSARAILPSCDVSLKAKPKAAGRPTRHSP